MSEYIGNYIEIIDQSGRSYRGVLSAISAETATVDLSSVDIYDQSGKLIEQKPSVHFQGRDVKDLKLLAKKKPQKVGTDDSTFTEVSYAVITSCCLPSEPNTNISTEFIFTKYAKLVGERRYVFVC